MKRLAVLGVAFATTFLVSCSSDLIGTGSSVPSGFTTTTGSDGLTYISEDAAKKVALGHAGFGESDVINLSISFEIDDGVPHYDVEFTLMQQDYEYEIHATSGAVISFEYDADKSSKSADSKSDSKKDSDSDSKAEVNTSDKTTEEKETTVELVEDYTEDEAIEIALAHAKVDEDEILNFMITKTTENKVEIYEIKFITTEMEYEYEIELATGKIVSYDFEKLSIPTLYDEDEEVISQEEALEIALDHAELDEDDVSKLKISSELETGLLEYEIEWVYEGEEYEYTVSGVSGEVLEFSVEEQ